jgi:hypothetical protein
MLTAGVILKLVDVGASAELQIIPVRVVRRLSIGPPKASYSVNRNEVDQADARPVCHRWSKQRVEQTRELDGLVDACRVCERAIGLRRSSNAIGGGSISGRRCGQVRQPRRHE